MKKYILSIFAFMLLLSCNSEKKNYTDGGAKDGGLTILRFENLVFGTPLADLHQTLVDKQYDYRFLFNTDVSMGYNRLKIYEKISIIRYVYAAVNSNLFY